MWTESKSRFLFKRRQTPNRTIVTDGTGQSLATFTDGCYTVTLRGPQRTLAQPSAANPVIHSTWVRVLPSPFEGIVEEAWLATMLAAKEPDVLQIAMQYIEGALPVHNAAGLQVAGAARYGPDHPDEIRSPGADWNDYLGIPAAHGRRVREPRASHYRSLDCSGFVRMVWGYRCGLPLTYQPGQGAIPRKSYQMPDAAPGTIVIPDLGAAVHDFSPLAPGDLVFFATSKDRPGQISHVGIYLGVDSGGHHRFISSRRTANGPTLGDVGGKSLLDGAGLYARGFRAARRL